MTLMRDEALACGKAAQAFLEVGFTVASKAGRDMLNGGVKYVEVLGRGSSSHAGTVLRYALAARGEVTMIASMPSIASRESMPHKGSEVAVVAISQSGKSPDLLRYAGAAKAAGARVVCLTNTPGSPLGALGDCDVPLCAGPELSVAATKSTVAAALAGLSIVAGYLSDDNLVKALHALPSRFDQSAAADWSVLTSRIVGARAVYVIGRGCDLGIAKEVALKISEAVGIPALAYSSAEFLHGPLGAVSDETPVIGFCSDPRERGSVEEALQRARAKGANTLFAHGFGGADLPLPAAAEPMADCLLALPPAYLAIEAAALKAGRNPDRPEGLAKVTETL